VNYDGHNIGVRDVTTDISYTKQNVVAVNKISCGLDHKLNAPTTQSRLLQEWRERAIHFEKEIQKAVVGQERIVRLATICLFARGHILLEGDVGVGKTTLLRALSRGLGGNYVRVEGTVDMMPNDILYHTYIADDGRPRVEPSEILKFADTLSVFFFNEINRARPQVHSLLLRLMAERSLSAFNRMFHFPNLLVFADRNMVEREETFELPAAARDRFLMELKVSAPTDRESRRRLVFSSDYHDVDRLIEKVESRVIDYSEISQIAEYIQLSVSAAPALEEYVLNLWRAITNPLEAGVVIPDIDISSLLKGGASPRGISYLIRAAKVRAWLEGRSYLTPDDIKDIFIEVISHRIFVDPIYALESDDVVRKLCAAVFNVTPAP
jgi:MoxR-like ATPase